MAAKRFSRLKLWRSVRAMLKHAGKDPDALTPEQAEELMVHILRPKTKLDPCVLCQAVPTIRLDGPQLIDLPKFRHWVVILKLSHTCSQAGAYLAEVVEPTSALRVRNAEKRIRKEWDAMQEQRAIGMRAARIVDGRKRRLRRDGLDPRKGWA
jgi:hypothetical protein